MYTQLYWANVHTAVLSKCLMRQLCTHTTDDWHTRRPSRIRPGPSWVPARKFYLVPLLKISPLGKCSQNWKMVWHFYGKIKIAIISSKNQFRPQFWAQIVAGVETHRYSPFAGPGDHFWQSYEENQVQKIRHRIHHTILKTAKSIFVPANPFCPHIQYRN